TGDVGTIISNGTIQDTVNRYTWSLPSGITIPSAGSITVTATCETSGSVSAAAGTLTIIATPTSGWTSVTNKTAAATGSDAQ
ncbi:baseplate J/gp47 family protein, partial [Acetobacter sp. DsW_059]